MDELCTGTLATVRMLMQLLRLLFFLKKNKIKLVRLKLSHKENSPSYLLAVQTAKSICIESKKKNMTSSDTDAPSGRQRACIVSNVANLSEMIYTKTKTNELN